MTRSHSTRAAWLASGAGLAAAAAFPNIGRAQGAVLAVGAGMVEANAQAYYAAEMGFFKKAGLNAEVHQLRSGTTIAAAIVAGDLQVGVSNVVSLASAHQRGVPFVLIAPGALYDTNVPNALIVVAPDSPIKEARELNGKTVGGISLGGLDQLAFDAYLDHNGADYTSVKFVEIPNAIMADALATGRIAAASMNDPELTAAGSRVKMLAKGWDAISKLFMQTAWFTTQDWLAKNKETARRFAAAMEAAGAWGMANPEAGAAIIEKSLKFKEPKARMRFAKRLDRGLLQPVFDAGAKYKLFGQVSAADFTWNGT